MSILILTKLRKIPENCASCVYYKSKKESGWGDVPTCSANNMPLESKIRHGRQAWCPLVESRPCKTIIDVRDTRATTAELIALRDRLPKHWEDWRMAWSAYHKRDGIPTPYPDDLKMLIELLNAEIERQEV
jgi:hypothetical protein